MERPNTGLKVWVPDFLLILLLLAAAGVFSIKYLALPISFDEHGFLWHGWNFLRHEIPYRDFATDKPLVNVFINAFALMVFGIKYSRLMPIIFTCAGAVMLYFGIKRISAGRAFAFLLTLSFIYFSFHYSYHERTLNESETYGLVFMVLAFAFLHWDGGRGTKSAFLTKFLGGVCCALAVNCKEPFLLVALPMAVASHLFEVSIPREEGRRRLWMVVLGAGTVTLLLTLYLLFNGALLDSYRMLYRNYIYSKYYALDMGWTVPRTWLGTVQYDIQRLWTGYLPGTPFLTFLPLYLVFLKRWKWGRFTVVNLAGMVAGLFVVTLGQCFLKHYFLMGFVSFLQPAVYGAVEAHVNIRKYSRGLWILILHAVAGLMLWQVVPALKNEIRWPEWRMDVDIPPDLVNAVERYSTRNDPIFLNTAPVWYVALGRGHSYRWTLMVDEYIRLYDGTDEKDKLRRLKLDMEKRLPKVIYLHNEYVPRQIKQLNAVIIPMLREHRYVQLAPGLFVLPPVIRIDDVPRGVRRR